MREEMSCKNCKLHKFDCTGHIDYSPCKDYESKPEQPVLLNYQYTPGIGHYKDCCVCVGECVCP